MQLCDEVDTAANVREHRGGADTESGGQGGVGLAHVQMRQPQQRLFAWSGSAPSGPHHGSAVADRIGEDLQGAVVHRYRRQVASTLKLQVGAG